MQYCHPHGIHHNSAGADGNALPQTGRVVGEHDLAVARRGGNRHQAVVHFLHLRRHTVHGCGKTIVIGHAEQYQIFGFQIRLRGKAGARCGKACHSIFPPGRTVLHIILIADVIFLIIRQVLHHLAVPFHLFIGQQQGFHQYIARVGIAHRFKVLFRNIGIIGKAHRHPVLVLVNQVACGA